MNKEEAEEFFAQVANQPIRYSGWEGDEEHYFIPESIRVSSDGDVSLRGLDEIGNPIGYPAMNGLLTDRHNHYWYFVAEDKRLDWHEEPPSKTHACTCDFHEVVMISGCQCGGI